MNVSRPSWDDYFFNLTKLTSTRSPCQRLQVGCILVKENRIIAQGYNGYLPGAPHEQVMKENHEIGTVHAEQNAIADCAKRGVSCDGTTAYITHYPCENCMKIMCAAGVKNIKYIDDYNNEKTVEYFAKVSNVTIERTKSKSKNTQIYANTEDGVLTTICIDQKLSEADAVKAQHAVIDDIRKANYRWLIDAEAVFEYYSNNGWNPHIHIATRRIDKEAKIKGNLIAKFIKKQKHGVYRIDVEKRPFQSAWNYISGNKKSDEKKDNVEKDKKMRETYSIDAVIKI